MIKVDKKRISYFLAALIILIAFVFALSTRGESGEFAYADSNLPVYNSVDDVYEISTAEQLLNLSGLINNGAQTSGKYYASLSYRLTNDISLQGYTWIPIGTDEYYDFYLDVTTPLHTLYDNDLDDKQKFTSIWEEKYVYVFLDSSGNVGAGSTFDLSANYYVNYRMPKAFYGEFDGAGYTVSGCSYPSSVSYGGFFGYLKNAYVHDLVIEDASISSSDDSNVLGGIAGKAENSIVFGCGLIDSSLSTQGNAGGIVGAATRITDTYSAVAELSGFVQDFSYEAFNQPRETRVDSCYSIGSAVSARIYAAGIVAQGEGSCTITNCYNNSVVNVQSRTVLYNNEEISVKTAGGIIATGDSSVAVSCCLGVYYTKNDEGVEIGAVKSAFCLAPCTYCYRVADEELTDRASNFYPDAGVTTCNLSYAVSSLRNQLGSANWLDGGLSSGSTYYYPVPATCGRVDTFTGYTVTENSIPKGLHYPGYIYNYPPADAAQRLGYTVARWSDGTYEHGCSTPQVLSGDLNVQPVWALNAPTLLLNNSYSFQYDAQTHSITPAFSHQLTSGLTATYTWTRSGETPFQAATLDVKNVADSDVYTCTVEITDGVLVAQSEEKVFFASVLANDLTVEIRLFANEEQNEGAKTHLYDGSAVSAPTYSVTGLIAGHVLTPTYSYKKNNATVASSETANVGSYMLSATIAVTEESTNCTNNYSVTVVPYLYTVTPADISVTCAHSSEWQVTYDGQAHTLTASDFAIQTVNDQPYELSIEGYYVNVTSGSTVTYTVTAPNHNAYNGEAQIVITPLVLTLAAKNVTFSKIYDGTDAIDLTNFVEGTAYTVTYDPCEGTQPVVQVAEAAYSQSNAGEDLTVTAVFSVSGNNFALASSSVEFAGCSIAKKEITLTSSYVFSKKYDGTTAADLSVLTASTYTVTDNVGVTPTNGAYNSSHVNAATAVTVRFSIKSNVQNNYRFSTGDTLEVVFSASISPISVSIAPTNGVSFTKTYDRTNVFDPSSIQTSAYSVVSENNVAVTPDIVSALFDSVHTDASNLTVTFSLSDDYVLTTPTVLYPASITPASVTLDTTTLQATGRSYDGTMLVEITGGRLTGVISGDEVIFDLSGGVIASKDASETPYSVTVNEITLRSDDYVLTNPTPSGLTVVISKAESTVRPQIESATVYYDDGLPEPVLSDGDTDGVISWNDENTFEIGNDLTFSWTFVPQDEVNFLPKTGTLTISVREDSLTDVRIYTMPTKLEYVALEAFDTTGMVVYTYWESGKMFRLEQNSPSVVGYVLTVDDTTTTYPGVLHYGNETLYVNYGGYSPSVSVVVTKIVLPLPAVSATERTYTGYPLSPAIENYDENAMTVSGDTSATNAGAYSFTITLQDVTDYEWSDQTTSEKSYSWSVLPAGRKPLTLSDTQFSYSGEAQTVTLRNDNNNDNGFFVAEGVFSATHAGDYSIRVNLIDENYYWIDPSDELDRTDVAEKVLSWTIRPKRITKPAIYDAPYVYTGYLLEIVTDTADEYVLSGDLAVTAAGSYAITAKLNNVYDGATLLYADYVWSDDGSSDPYVMNYTVEKKKVEVPSPGIGNVVYNGSVYSVKIRSNSLYTVGGTRQTTDAGNYQVTVSLVDKNNHCWTDGTTENKAFGWSISPMQIAKPTVLRQNSYSGYEQTAGISVSDYYTLTGNVAKDVGSYVATATLKDKINYRWEGGSTSDVDVEWAISRSVIVVPAAPKNLLYNGFEQTAYIESNAAYTITGNVGKDRGNYTATVALKDTTGYIWDDETTAPKSFSWGIYGITIVSDGASSPITASYSLGELLYTPVRSGYLFSGWYSSSDYSESSRITSIDEIGEDMTLYAKWTKTQTDDKGDQTGEVTVKKPSSTLSKSSRDKIIAGAVILGACLVAALLLLILGKKR